MQILMYMKRLLVDYAENALFTCQKYLCVLK